MYHIGTVGHIADHIGCWKRPERPLVIRGECNQSDCGDESRPVRFSGGVQPNFGYKSRYFSAAISTQFVNLIYSNVEGDLIFDHINQVDFLREHPSYWLAEPALTVRGGLEKVKLQVQLGLSYNITDPQFSQETGFITVGLNFSF